MLRVLDRYLLREVLASWLAVTLVLWAIVVVNRLVRYLGEAAAGEIPASVIMTLLGLKSISYLTTLLPLALFLGVLLALGRLYRDSEMVALAACGVGPVTLYRPLLALAGVVALLLALLALEVAPRTAALGYELRAQAEAATDIGGVVAGRFQEAREGQLIFYAERVSGGQAMENVFVRDLRNDPPLIVTARRAEVAPHPETGDRFLVLEDGWRYQGLPGDPAFRIMRFERHGLRVEYSGTVTVPDKQDARPTPALLASASAKDIAELQWRLSLPLAAVMLTWLALPLARARPRDGRWGRLFIAVLVFVVYYNLLGTAQVWVERGLLPPLPGVWWVHALPLLLGGLLWWRARPRPGRVRT